ncbi:MAG: glycine cleavage system aminomethyltransferase GcvT [Planctomycetota bacterium]
MPQKTCLHALHERLGGKLVDFHGWSLPVQYAGILAEHRHTRSAVSLFDTCHMGQFVLRGEHVGETLDRILVQPTAAMKVGRCKYGFLLNEAGGILDDTIIMRLGDEEFFLVVNAGPRESDFAWLREKLPGAIELVEQSAWGKLDIQGPLAAEVLTPHTEADLTELKYFGVTRTGILGRECILSRTGYTGELGYEIFYPTDGMVELFEALLAHEHVKPAGLGARDSLRLEMCYPLYGQDITQQTTPIEADMAFFCPMGDEFVGASALRAQRDEGIARRLVAFCADTRRRANTGDTILRDGDPVGEVTSGAFSPMLETSIGLGYVQADCSAVGSTIVIDTGRAQLEATIAEKPLYTKGTCRTTLG